MNDGSLKRLALWCSRHYGRVFGLTLAALVVAGFFISRLHLDGDITNLLPKKDPVLNAYLGTLADFGTFDYLLITVPIPEGRAADPYEAYADALAERLRQIPELLSVDHRIEEPEKLIRDFLPNAMLFASEADRAELARRLSSSGVTDRAAELRRLLATPQSLVLKDLARLDPLGVTDIFMGRFETGQGAMAVDWMSGYYLSTDQRLLLLLAKPKRPPQDIDFNRAMVAKVEAAFAATRADWAEIAGPEAPPPPVPRVGGPHVSAMVDEQLIRKDMTLNVVSSIALVLVLFLFAFRRLTTLVYAFLPLVVGLVLTFGFAGATFGVLSSATSGTAALLIGLGIDFVIVSYGRFVEERRAGRGFEEALSIVMGSCMRGVIVGAVTTAASFYAFTFTDFRGLRQMGILTGSGIVLCLGAVLVLLPAMLGWSEAHHSRRATQPRLYLHSFAIDRLVGFCWRRPWAVLGVGTVITAICAVLSFRITFSDSWRDMRPAGNPGVEVENEVQEHFKSDFDYMMLILADEDVDALLARTHQATEKAKGLVRSGVLTGVSSITSYLPPRADQEAVLAWLAKGRADGSLDPARIRADFEAAVKAEGLRGAPFEEGLAMLAGSLSAERVLAIKDLELEGQAGRLIGRLLHKKGELWQSVIQLYQPAERWRREAPPEAHALAKELGPDVILTGANVVNKVMRERVRRDAWIGVVLGTILVFLLLLADFRDVQSAAFCLVPLGVGVVWMLGGMVLLGQSMNFMNVFVTTMIIGIGVDYGLHMLHRYYEIEHDGGDLLAGLSETGNAVVVAALTTVVGFGSMSLSHYPGLRTTGYVAILGAMSATIVAVTLLPAYLSLRRAGRG